MKRVAYNATVTGLVGNSFLLLIKLAAGLLSGSIALFSDAFNSLTDVVASLAIFVCVRISDSEADEGHPFGHKRAEPIAGLTVAILAGILAFEIMRKSISRLLTGKVIVVNGVILAVPVVTMAIKWFMATYFHRVGTDLNSPAIRAAALDSRNDLYIAGATLLGIGGARFGYYFLDPVAGIVISCWIVYTGYRIGMENIDYLMGKSPEPELLDSIKRAALSVNGVKSLNAVRAHYVGNFIHVEIHIEVNKDLSTLASHEIGTSVEEVVEEVEAIEKSFVHIDPI